MPDAPFGRGDVWILRYRAREIDDGVVAVGPPYEANFGPWINGESVNNKDVVIWYGAHFTHDLSQEHPAMHGHIVGPDLKPIHWR
jgi:Cu2+-containing amine oxidase